MENLFSNFLEPLIFAGWVMVWWVWFRLQRPAWLPRAAAGLTVVYIVAVAIGGELFFRVFPIPWPCLSQVIPVVRLLFLALLLWIVIQGIRRQGLEGWLVLPAVLLLGIAHFSTELILLHIRVVWFHSGCRSVGFMAYLLLLVAAACCCCGGCYSRSALRGSWRLDVKQAQEVQQVILPEARTTLPGLVIESEYRPAREVGGDFFQIIPNRAMAAY